MSKIEVNQISSQCGSTLTIGQSGDTVTLAAGATQSGFGRTGTVDWDTTAKTTNFTAVSGTGYFVNTTSAAITLTLPATPSAGDIVAFKDYAFTFATNNLSVDGNGSPIGGVDGSLPVSYNTNGTSKTFIYVDGTKGWLVTNESTDTSQEVNPAYIVATGGTITCCGDYKIHTFTGPGTFTVCSVGNPFGSNTVDYLVVAGGGGGGGPQDTNLGGGGGGGGFRLSNSTCMPAPTTSPLASPTALPVTATGYPITVGGGGSGGTGVAPPGLGPTQTGSSGSNSVFSTITSAGGGGAGGGGPGCNPWTNGLSGGSGGGSGGGGQTSTGGSGNTPPVSPPQGNNGGAPSAPRVPDQRAGGGGGAGAVGGTNPNAQPSGPNGDGGAGSYVVSAGFGGCNGTPGPVCGARYFAGGGGGGGGASFTPGAGGAGGGGAGGPSSSPYVGIAGTTNTGGGGGAGGACYPACGRGNGGAGGSGIVIIRYKYQ